MKSSISSTSFRAGYGCAHSWAEFVRSHSLNASTGIRILDPIFRTGNPGCFTSSYAFGRLIPSFSDKSCTLIVAFSISFLPLFLINGYTKATSRTHVRLVADLYSPEYDYCLTACADLFDRVICCQIPYAVSIAFVDSLLRLL